MAGDGVETFEVVFGRCCEASEGLRYGSSANVLATKLCINADLRDKQASAFVQLQLTLHAIEAVSTTQGAPR